MIESRWIKVGEIKTHYLFGGQGLPLVLLHGGGNDARNEWQANLEPLAQNYMVYAPDLVGFGLSDKPRVIYSAKFLTDFFTDFMNLLKLERASLIGHSLGGAIAVNFALKQPNRVEKLVLVDSLGMGQELGLVGKLLTLFFVLRAKIRRDWVFLNLLNEDKKGLGKQGIVLLDKLPELEIPTLIVWGGWDGYFPVKQAYQAHRLLKNSQLKVFKRCWHAPQRERPEEFNQLVLDFLKQ